MQNYLALKNAVTDVGMMAGIADRFMTGTVKLPLDEFELENVLALFNDLEKFLNQIEGFLDKRNLTITPDNVINVATANFRPDLMQDDHLSQILMNPKVALCNITQTKKFVLNVAISDLQAVLDVVCSLGPGDVFTLGEIFEENMNKSVLEVEANKFLVANGGAELHYEAWTLLQEVGGELAKDLAEYGTIKTFVSDIEELLREVVEIFSEISEFSQAQAMTSDDDDNDNDVSVLSGPSNSTMADLKFLSSMSRLVCGREFSFSAFSSGGQSNRFDELRDRIKTKDDEEDKYVNDNSTTEECNEMMRELENSRGVQFLWSQLKPFIRGKVLYTPDTPATRKLMEVVNMTFTPFLSVKDFLRNWTESYGSSVRDFLLNPENQQSIMEVFTSAESPFGIILDTLQSQNSTGMNKSDILERMKNYFEGNFSDTWEGFLDRSEE